MKSSNIHLTHYLCEYRELSQFPTSPKRTSAVDYVRWAGGFIVEAEPNLRDTCEIEGAVLLEIDEVVRAFEVVTGPCAIVAAVQQHR